MLRHIDLLQKQNALFPAFATTHSASGSKGKDELLPNRAVYSASIYFINFINKILDNRTFTLLKSVLRFIRIRISLE